MEHFYRNIHGWFDFQNHYANMVHQCSNNSHFVEVGSWKGCSSAFMAVEIANSGKNIKFDCIDTWEGSIEHQLGGPHTDEYVVNGTLYDHFLENMKPVAGYFTPIRLSSVEASKLYENNSLDFVFIDAGHDYESVKADIISWFPKVKKGGWIGGHDYTWSDGVRLACNELIPEHSCDPSWNKVENRFLPENIPLGVSWMYQIK